MRKPLEPPEITQLFPKASPDRLPIIAREGRILVAGKYIHWDNLRHRDPPAGLTHEEWWLGVKMARMGAQERLPFVDKNGWPFTFVFAAPVREGLHKVDQKLGVWGHRSDVRDIVDGRGREYVLTNSILEEAITSSQLEGATTTRARAREMIRTGRRPRSVDERMILNNYRAIQRIEGLAQHDLTEADVFSLHRMLTEGTLEDVGKAGVFRESSDDVVVELVGSHETAHVPPPPSELPERLGRLLKFANGNAPGDWLHPVLRAVILHFMIGYDHPFVDGNGRVARALFYWAMLRHGYQLAQFLSVSTILRKAPAQYSRSYLLTETDSGDLTYFIDYHLGVVNRSIEALLEYVGRKTAGIRKLERKLLRSRHLNNRQIRLLSHALRNPGFRYTVRSHQTSNRIAANTARADLVDLARQELLAWAKQGRRHEFIAPADLAERL